ncbi:transposase [Rhodoferax sp.]|uniref:IS66-like element accessory protein TnpA n=1 Tax=Rhodoferax sp. TaxID=50421 RepID=UPI0026293716|nr:transposase [Rhodoferax sp.]MDD3938011.1 transposase [Rhodoferax sp.]
MGHKRDGRCQYDPQVKQELIRQCMMPGVSVARMAMQHGINANLLRMWITKSQSSKAITVQRAVCETAARDAQAFIPVQVEAGASNAAVAMPTKACGAANKSPAVSMRIHVQLPNGISVDLGQARMQELIKGNRLKQHNPAQ